MIDSWKLTNDNGLSSRPKSFVLRVWQSACKVQCFEVSLPGEAMESDDVAAATS